MKDCGSRNKSEGALRTAAISMACGGQCGHCVCGSVALDCGLSFTVQQGEARDISHLSVLWRYHWRAVTPHGCLRAGRCCLMKLQMQKTHYWDRGLAPLVQIWMYSFPFAYPHPPSSYNHYFQWNTFQLLQTERCWLACVPALCDMKTYLISIGWEVPDHEVYAAILQCCAFACGVYIKSTVSK